jgi:hypothetical protein
MAAKKKVNKGLSPDTKGTNLKVNTSFEKLLKVAANSPKKKDNKAPKPPKKDDKLKVSTSFENLLKIAANTPKKRRNNPLSNC